MTFRLTFENFQQHPCQSRGFTNRRLLLAMLTLFSVIWNVCLIQNMSLYVHIPLTLLWKMTVRLTFENFQQSPYERVTTCWYVCVQLLLLLFMCVCVCVCTCIVLHKNVDWKEWSFSTLYCWLNRRIAARISPCLVSRIQRTRGWASLVTNKRAGHPSEQTVWEMESHLWCLTGENFSNVSLLFKLLSELTITLTFENRPTGTCLAAPYRHRLAPSDSGQTVRFSPVLASASSR